MQPLRRADPLCDQREMGEQAVGRVGPLVDLLSQDHQSMADVQRAVLYPAAQLNEGRGQ